jgi:hypothetical protein
MNMEMPLAIGGELAQIFLKNGRNFFGIVLNDLESPESFDHEVRYVRPADLSNWIETSDEGLVEIIDPDHIDGIDLYLK